MSPTDAIPLTLITGFLGAGKTTYLNRLIRQGLPKDSMILVNDFGAINIDAELIEYQDDRVLKMANGCICCSLGGTLAAQLSIVLQQPVTPGALYIEASGIAQPERIADIARLSDRLTLVHIDCLVDAGQIERHRQDAYTGEIWLAQIRAADRLFVNRLSVDEAIASDQLAQLEALNPAAEQVPDPERSSDRAAPRPSPAGGGRMVSCNRTFDGAVSAKTLEALFDEFADVLLRAKGILHCVEYGSAQVVQLSGGRTRWYVRAGAPRNGQLVCIGIASERFETFKTRLNNMEKPHIKITGKL